ncbi:MAG TPA: hypothetical protein VN709_00050 [Terriglobales bacterium]|nr:hypothetical protein [Terriglobales bacterium]
MRRVCVALGLFCVTALGQNVSVPLLVLRAIQTQGSGQRVVLAKNRYHAAATEFLVAINYRPSKLDDACLAVMPTGGQSCWLRNHKEPQIGFCCQPGSTKPGAYRLLAESEGSVAIFGSIVKAFVSLDNPAVIYADGSAAGDPGLVGLIMANRSQRLHNAEEGLALLAKDLGAPEISVADVEAQFAETARAHNAKIDPRLVAYGYADSDAESVQGHLRLYENRTLTLAQRDHALRNEIRFLTSTQQLMIRLGMR